jgi:flagellar basal body-associated protein FliL
MSVAGKGKDDEAPKKGKNKKVGIIVLLLVGLFAGKTMFLKPKPMTPEEKAAAEKAAELEREAYCSHANDYTDPDAEHAKEDKDAVTSTTVPEEPKGPILELDSVTVNLADGHYLKLGLGLQLPEGTLMEEIESEGIGAPALDKAIELFSTRTMQDLVPAKNRSELRGQLGYELCTAHESIISKVYFTDFVMQ